MNDKNNTKSIQNQIKKSIETKKFVLDHLVPSIQKIANMCVKTLKSNNKIILCGNGGSAADSQHLAAELVGRFRQDRKAIPAIALTTDTSIITSVANDYSFDSIFSRQIEAIGRPGDIVIVISTSGNSSNLIKVVETAKLIKIKSIGLLGKNGGTLKNMCDASIIIPGETSDRIQESHIMIGHIMCEIIESYFLK